MIELKESPLDGIKEIQEHCELTYGVRPALPEVRCFMLHLRAKQLQEEKELMKSSLSPWQKYLLTRSAK